MYPEVLRIGIKKGIFEIFKKDREKWRIRKLKLCIYVICPINI